MVDLAEKNTRRLIVLVNDLLDVEKLRSGQMVFHMAKTSLSEIVTNAIETNKPYADERKVALAMTETIADAFVNGDGERLAQVLANLLSNAAKFSPEGKTVEVSLSRCDDGFRVSVRDHGPGIPDGFREQVFDRFAQADGTDTRQQGGTGLGLNISRSIVEQHGGVIDFEPMPGDGAVFYFELPEYAGG